jgi:hypothetical protein
LSSIRDDLYLIDDAEQEHSFRFESFDLACRSGHRITVLHALRRGSASGPYVAVRNHSTGVTWWTTGAIPGARLAEPLVVSARDAAVPGDLQVHRRGHVALVRHRGRRVPLGHVLVRKPRVERALRHAEDVLQAASETTPAPEAPAA